jgi:hypothetical protein
VKRTESVPVEGEPERLLAAVMEFYLRKLHVATPSVKSDTFATFAHYRNLVKSTIGRKI